MSKPSAAMHPDLHKLLTEVRHKRNFNAKEWIDKKTDLFNEYMSKNHLSGCVVSVSGGVDSALTLALMLHASKKPNSPIKKVLGIAQPIHSTASIQNRAFEVAKALGADIVTVDQTQIFDQVTAIVDKAVGVEGGKFARGQMRSYMRTPSGYYVAQLLSQAGFPCVVMGTGNKDEDGFLLYFCKAGDGVCDLQLIADLHKSEVFKAAAQLGVSESILKAPPSADLWEGQTDEDELGFSYDFVELYTQYLTFDKITKEEFKNKCSKEAWDEFTKCGELAEATHRRNAHKLNRPLNIDIL